MVWDRAPSSVLWSWLPWQFDHAWQLDGSRSGRTRLPWSRGPVQGPSAVQRFPATRYQGSKLKLLPWLWQAIEHLTFDTALDLFSGSGSVSYLFKSKNVEVTANDYLRCNQVVARALVVNEEVTLGEGDSSGAVRAARRA